MGVKLQENYQRQKNAALKNSIESNFSSNVPTTTDLLESFNMNMGYLLSILRLIDEFTIIKVNGLGGIGKQNIDYYMQMWEILDMIINLISCKLKPDIKKELDVRLKIVLEKIETIFQEGSDDTFINKKIAFNVRTELGKIFEDILVNMEKRGLLTFKQDEPTTAMGRFTD